MFGIAPIKPKGTDVFSDDHVCVGYTELTS